MFKIVRTFVLAFCAISFFACKSVETTTLTIVQYNVGVFDKYDESGFDAIASAVREMGADVVTLNELDSCTLRTGGVFQLDAFAQEMGQWGSHYASAMPYNGGAYGVGVAYKPEYKVIRTDKIALPKVDGREPRTVAVVEFEDFVLCSTHLGLSLNSQLGQVEAINRYMDSMYADCTKPIFLGGDFNCRPGSEPIELLRKTWTLLTPETVSFPSHAPDRCIDYIFVRPGSKEITVEAASIPQTLQTVNLATASDHLPVALTVRVK